MTSGYTPCACRDCMDIAITAAEGGWTLCWECLEAGCTPLPPATGEWPGRRPEGDYECQRDDAYGEEPEEYIYRAYHRRDCPSPWFHSNPGHVCSEPGER
jgi:hypothetical protein